MVECRTHEQKAHASEPCTIQFETKVNGNGRSALTHIADFSRPAIVIELPFELGAGEAIELQLADSVIYATVIYSRATNSSFETAIQAARVTVGDTALATLLRRVLAEQIPQLAGLDPLTEAHLS